MPRYSVYLQIRVEVTLPEGVPAEDFVNELDYEIKPPEDMKANITETELTEFEAFMQPEE